MDTFIDPKSNPKNDTRTEFEWYKEQDPDSKAFYYYNPIMLLTVWERPTSIAWQQEFDPKEGAHYYVNLNTGESTWDEPKEPFIKLGASISPIAQRTEAPSGDSLFGDELDHKHDAENRATTTTTTGGSQETPQTRSLNQLLQGPGPNDFDLPAGVKVREDTRNKIGNDPNQLAKVYAPKSNQTPKKDPNKPEEKESWVSEVFADENNNPLTEGQLREKYVADKARLQKNIPPSFQIQQINEEYERVKKQKTQSSAIQPAQTKTFVVVGVDAIALPSAKATSGGIVQVASQFNALESMSKERAALSIYPFDPTQGPRAVMPCANALFQRDTIMHYDAFEDVMPDEATRKRFVQGGYVTWNKDPAEFQAQLGANNENVQKLRILSMWTKPELADTEVLQCYTAAAPTSAYGNSGNKKQQDEIAEALVVEQYTAIAKMAVIRARETGQTVPLHLTFVGGGAFENDPKILQKAFKEVENILQNENVELYIHAYRLQNEFREKNTGASVFVDTPGYTILKGIGYLDENQMVKKAGVEKLNDKQFFERVSPFVVSPPAPISTPTVTNVTETVPTTAASAASSITPEVSKATFSAVEPIPAPEASVVSKTIVQTGQPEPAASIADKAESGMAVSHTTTMATKEDYSKQITSKKNFLGEVDQNTAIQAMKKKGTFSSFRNTNKTDTYYLDQIDPGDHEGGTLKTYAIEITEMGLKVSRGAEVIGIFEKLSIFLDLAEYNEVTKDMKILLDEAQKLVELEIIDADEFKENANSYFNMIENENNYLIAKPSELIQIRNALKEDSQKIKMLTEQFRILRQEAEAASVVAPSEAPSIAPKVSEASPLAAKAAESPAVSEASNPKLQPIQPEKVAPAAAPSQPESTMADSVESGITPISSVTAAAAGSEDLSRSHPPTTAPGEHATSPIEPIASTAARLSAATSSFDADRTQDTDPSQSFTPSVKPVTPSTSQSQFTPTATPSTPMATQRYSPQYNHRRGSTFTGEFKVEDFKNKLRSEYGPDSDRTLRENSSGSFEVYGPPEPLLISTTTTSTSGKGQIMFNPAKEIGSNDAEKHLSALSTKLVVEVDPRRGNEALHDLFVICDAAEKTSRSLRFGPKTTQFVEDLLKEGRIPEDTALYRLAVSEKLAPETPRPNKGTTLSF